MTSKDTFCPSFNVPRPALSRALIWTNTSREPSSGYEDEESQFGWFIEAIDPEEREFASNLRPVSYLSRSLGGIDDPDTGGA